MGGRKRRARLRVFPKVLKVCDFFFFWRAAVDSEMLRSAPLAERSPLFGKRTVANEYKCRARFVGGQKKRLSAWSFVWPGFGECMAKLTKVPFRRPSFPGV